MGPSNQFAVFFKIDRCVREWYHPPIDYAIFSALAQPFSLLLASLLLVVSRIRDLVKFDIAQFVMLLSCYILIITGAAHPTRR